MSDQYVADDERDAILDRLLTIPDNKVRSLIESSSDLFRLQEQEPQMGIFQHRHIPLLPVHVSS
jgi:hypothetical protein